MSVESDCENESDLRSGIHKVELSTLPELSKKKYEAVYKWFMDWQKHRNLTSFSEEVLMDYFKEISNKFKSSTLWAHYSMLRTTLNMYNNVDISQYLRLKAFLKQQSDGYQPKKGKTFTSRDINKFITEAPDNQYLLAKVALIMGVMGGCRGHELHQMKITNINDLGSAVIITIPNTRTKFLRTFTITGYHYEIFKKYAVLRPSNVRDSNFFLNYVNGKCSTVRLGINKLGAMGKEIAKYLKLPNPELYTGHNFRKSCATVLIDSDEYITSSRQNYRILTEKCVEPTNDLLECKASEISESKTNENMYDEPLESKFEYADCNDTLDNKYEEGSFENMYVRAANQNAYSKVNNANAASTSKTQICENQDNLTLEYNFNNVPKMIFNNCTNVTINIINDNK